MHKTVNIFKQNTTILDAKLIKNKIIYTLKIHVNILQCQSSI